MRLLFDLSSCHLNSWLLNLLLPTTRDLVGNYSGLINSFHNGIGFRKECILKMGNILLVDSPLAFTHGCRSFKKSTSW